ncbi:MAG: OmpA family protein [Gammaproteobacteria bacterium]
MSNGHKCADNLYHANLHLANGKRVSGKFMNSGEMIVDEGIGHASEAASQCARAQQALSAFIDEKLGPLEARVKRLEGFHEIVASVKPEGIYFAFNRYDLNAESRAVLDSLYSNLESRGYPMVEIAGYTDDIGSDEYNQALSERRAQSVLDYLVSLGVPSDKLSARGFGEGDPIASNDTEAGRAQNRRVELHIFQ